MVYTKTFFDVLQYYDWSVGGDCFFIRSLKFPFLKLYTIL